MNVFVFFTVGILVRVVIDGPLLKMEQLDSWIPSGEQLAVWLLRTIVSNIVFVFTFFETDEISKPYLAVQHHKYKKFLEWLNSACASYHIFTSCFLLYYCITRN